MPGIPKGQRFAPYCYGHSIYAAEADVRRSEEEKTENWMKFEVGLLPELLYSPICLLKPGFVG